MKENGEGSKQNLRVKKVGLDRHEAERQTAERRGFGTFVMG